MMKIVGIAILMISSVLLGMSFYKKYKARPEDLNIFITLLNSYIVELKWKRKTFVDVVKQFKNDNRYLFSFASLLPFNSVLDSAITKNNEFNNLFLEKKDIEILEHFFNNTGKGSMESEVSLCQSTIELLKNKRDEAEIKMKKMGPLALKICIIIGIWIAVIML